MLKLIVGNKNYSSWSLRPWIAMKQMRLEFEEERIALYKPESAGAIAQFSPAGKVPILVDGDRVVWDSTAIMDYLAERCPDKPWWPADVDARALARCVSAEMHSGFFGLREYLPMNCKARFPGKGLTPESEKDIARVRQIWTGCSEQFGGPFLFGPFSIADAMYAPVVLRFVTYGVAVNAAEQAYMDAVLALPAMQDWVEAGLAETEAMPHYDNMYA